MGSIKNILVSSLKKKLKEHWDAFDKKLNFYELEEKHLQNAKLLPNRIALLDKLPKNGIVAELGVNKGEFSSQILELNKPSRLHLVDIWDSERYHDGLRNMVENKFSEEISDGKVEINLGLSTTVVDGFKENYFDWVYIDTDHTYKTTLEELEKYAPKVKKDGYLSGHDFTIGSWNYSVKYGVIQAVYEFCNKNSWEIAFITMENQGAQSFALRRITQ